MSNNLDTASRLTIERLAKRLCSQENEIWEEAGYQSRRRWINEALTTIAELETPHD